VVLLLVTLALFTDLLLYDLVVPFLPAHLRQEQVSPIGIGALFGAYALALLIATPFTGRWCDRLGARGLLQGGLLGLLVATLLCAFTDRFAMLLAARLCQGVASAALWTAGLALIADAFPAAARGRAMGTALAGMSAATLLGPPLGGILFDGGGYRLPFLLGAALVLAVLALACWLPIAARAGPQPAPAGLLGRDRRFLLTAGVVVVGSTVLSLLEPTLPLYLGTRFGASPATIGLLFGAATLAYGICSPLAGMFADRWGGRAALTIGLVATAVVLPLVCGPGSLPGEIAVLVLLGIACAFLLAPTLPELADAADRCGHVPYGSAYSLFSAAYAVGMLLGPVLGGLATAGLGLAPALVLVSLGIALYVPVFVAIRPRAALPT
jgi:multidrug resistance protein